MYFFKVALKVFKFSIFRKSLGSAFQRDAPWYSKDLLRASVLGFGSARDTSELRNA